MQHVVLFTLCFSEDYIVLYLGFQDGQPMDTVNGDVYIYIYIYIYIMCDCFRFVPITQNIMLSTCEVPTVHMCGL